MFVCFGGSRGGVSSVDNRGLPPKTSNFYCLPGRAGGTPICIRNVPGRKTDVKDSEWICDLARHGLIASSFVPPRAIRDLRDLTRYRRKLVEAQSAERNRLIKLLESAGIKLAGVASDVFGVSGRAMLHALIEGDQSPAEMAKLARGRMRRKLSE